MNGGWNPSLEAIALVGWEAIALWLLVIRLEAIALLAWSYLL